MKLKFCLLLSIICVTVSSCYDDSAIWDSIKDHESRISKLEILCGQLNTNITSIQEIIASIKNNENASNISPIMENDKVIGYTIAFSNGKSVTVYTTGGGNENAVGLPSIGVKADIDGTYYWAIDGEWILTEDNKKIPAVGKDGITPKLKIEDGYWCVSYDTGKTWTRMENGMVNSGSCVDPLFTKVNYNESYIYLTCSDGTVLTIARTQEFNVTLDLDKVVWTPGQISKIKYTLTGVSGDSDIFTISENEWSSTVVKTSETEGYIQVSIPETDYSVGRFTLWVSNNGKTSVKRVTYSDAKSSVINLEIPVQTVNHLGGDLQVFFCSDIETEIIIPEDAKDWISILETKAKLCYTQTLHIAKNLSSDRSASIVIKNEYSELEFKVTQTGISGIRVQPSKAIIKADGIDYTEIKVLTDEGEDVTEYSYILDSNNQQLQLTDGKFTTTEEGAYEFSAIYLTHSSDPCVLYALNNVTAPMISDQEPSNTSFKHRSFLLRYTGTNCPFCVQLMDQINLLKEESIITNDAVLAVAHTFNDSDPAYIPSKYLKVDSYPYLTINNRRSHWYIDGYDKFANLIESEKSEDAAVGIAVNSTLSGEYLIATVGVKAAEEGNYYVTLWILQDQIYGAQTGATDKSYNYHDDCVIEHLPSGVDPLIGYSLGTLKTGEIAEKLFITERAISSPENYHLVVTVTKKDNDAWYVCNAVDCPITGLTNFEYKH